nr:GNAT family N-acetyltransferase [Deinobacterium chartae]
MTSAQEAGEVEELQLAVWGRSERDVVPKGLLIAASMHGGMLAGAFDGERMVGFAFGFATHDPATLHSHMVGVLPEYRGAGVGLQLKLYQKQWCLAHGLTRMQWTYDPLRGANASFNLRKLGATVRRYWPDLYGPMTGMNAGVPSDRALAEWELLAPPRAARDLRDLEAVNRPEGEAPAGWTPDLTAPRLKFWIPRDFGALLLADPALALAWRLESRAALQHYLGRGYALTGFSSRDGNAYLLERGE